VVSVALLATLTEDQVLPAIPHEAGQVGVARAGDGDGA
jgi:hypothetical protein